MSAVLKASPRNGTHLAPINLENAKLGGYLSDGGPGLDLTVSEDRALTAVSILIDRATSDPRAELQLRPRGWQPVNGRRVLSRVSSLPAVTFTWKAYEEAYGLTRDQRRHQGKMVQDARKALLLIAGVGPAASKHRQWRVLEYPRSANRKKEGTRSRMLVLGRLVVLPGWGTDQGEDSSELTLIPTPVLVEGTQDPNKPHYITKRNRLHGDISSRLDEIYGIKQNRYPEIHLLVSRILTQRRAELKFDLDDLMVLLRLRRERSPAKRVERLNRAIAIAYQMGYLAQLVQLPVPRTKDEQDEQGDRKLPPEVVLPVDVRNVPPRQPRKRS